MKLIYDVTDKPKLSKTLVFAFQQMIAIMAATLLVPMLVSGYGLEADVAAALFGAGIGTIVYLLSRSAEARYSSVRPLRFSARIPPRSARITATGA